VIELLQKALDRLLQIRDDLQANAFEFPPENMEKFMRIVGEREGITKAIIEIEIILKGVEDEG
jgi:hypothetical protein